MTNLVIIGGGPGGTAAATRAAQLGARVTLIEQRHLGGSCVNLNCIPLTGMLASITLFDRIKRASQLGIQVSEPRLNLEQARARVSNIVDELREGTGNLITSFGVEVITGTARLRDRRTVIVGDRTIEADAITIATGAHPIDPPFPIENALSARQALELDQPPARLLVWGSGAIELEFAQFFALAGSHVTLIAAGANVLLDEDYEVGQRLQTIMAGQGIQVLTNATLKSVADGKAIISQRKGETAISVDRALWVGHAPNLAGLGLEAIGVKVAEGAIKIDDYCQTSLPGVYAIGDVAGHPMYSYVATYQGLIAAENIMGHKRKADLRAMPRCIYTIPEAACVGLSENEAEDKGFDVEVSNISLETNVRAQTLDEAVGGIKIVFDRKFGKLLGVHIVGQHATELIAEAALALQLEALAEDFAWALRGHPTLSESMVEAGRAFSKQALYIPKW